jgi:hypothetical protein
MKSSKILLYFMLLALYVIQIYWIDLEMKLADGNDHKMMHKFNAVRSEERTSLKTGHDTQ